jgi:hypothetical protein
VNIDAPGKSLVNSGQPVQEHARALTTQCNLRHFVIAALVVL